MNEISGIPTSSSEENDRKSSIVSEVIHMGLIPIVFAYTEVELENYPKILSQTLGVRDEDVEEWALRPWISY